MEKYNRLAIAFVLLLTLSISAYSITQPHMLSMNSYSELLATKNILQGNASGARPLHQLTAFIYGISNSSGSFNSVLLMNIAKVLVVIFSVLSALALYFMLKQILSEIAAIGGAVLLASSQSFMIRMSSGVYSSDSLGMCALILGCSAFFLFYNKKNYLFLLLSLLLLGLSSVSWNAGPVMVGGVALSLLIQLIYQCRGKLDKMLAYGVVGAFAIFMLSYLAFPQQSIFKDMKWDNLQIHILNVPLVIVGIVAFAAWVIGRHKCRAGFELFIASFFVFSVIVGVYDVFSPAFGVAIFSAFALEEMIGLKDERLAIAIFAIALFFTSFEFSHSLLSTEQALLASFLAAATTVFIASLYRERRITAYLVFSIVLFSLFSSIGAAALLSMQKMDSITSGVDETTNWVGESLPQNAEIWAYRISPMVEFNTGRKGYLNDTEFARFMLSNDSVDVLKGKNITHVIIDVSLFDDIETLKALANNSKVRIDSFRFFRYETDQQGSIYAAFVSRDGRFAFAQADPTSGNLLEGNVVIAGGDSRRVVPLSKFLVAGRNRLVYPQDNYRVNIFMMFFEDISGLKNVHTSEEGDIKVYEVAK